MEPTVRVLEGAEPVSALGVGDIRHRALAIRRVLLCRDRTHNRQRARERLHPRERHRPLRFRHRHIDAVDAA
eukprot:4902606-Pleurochrysis_carterae.AAC.1